MFVQVEGQGHRGQLAIIVLVWAVTYALTKSDITWHKCLPQQDQSHSSSSKVKVIFGGQRVQALDFLNFPGDVILRPIDNQIT